MRTPVYKLLILTIVISPGLLAFILSYLLPEGIETGPGYILFGIIATVLSFLIGYPVERYAKRNQKPLSFQIITCSFIQGFFCLWLLVSFATEYY
jgi:hypothetical protein